MSYQLPFEPYITNAMLYYKIDPTFEPLKFYTMLRDAFGARAVGHGWDSDLEWEFDSETERTVFALRWS
jgi:hypothetical protein